MRLVVGTLATLLATFAIDGTQHGAQADPYRWCAELGGGDDSSTNCYFYTRAQCEATVAGVGGFCRLNQFYTGPETATGGDAAPVQPSRTDNKKRNTR